MMLNTACDISRPDPDFVYMMKPDFYSQVTKNVTDGEIIDAIPEEMIHSIGREIIELGAALVLMKCGRRGAYLFTGDVRPLNDIPGMALSLDRWNHREIRSAAFSTDAARIKNASGAGDVAVAGFLTAILKGENPEPAVKYAMCAGRNNLYGMTATDGLTDWETMTREINLEQRRN